MKISGCILVSLLIMSDFLCNTEYQQQKAYILYANPKYLIDVQAVTYRRDKNSKYITNMSETIVHPLENNCTLFLEFYNKKKQTEGWKVESLLCNLLKSEWIYHWLRTNTDFPTQCPVHAGMYHVHLKEFPPKNMPMIIGKDNYLFRLMMIGTKTKEKMLEMTIDLIYKPEKKGRE